MLRAMIQVGERVRRMSPIELTEIETADVNDSLTRC
jgi:hypothetical protein